MKKVLAIVLALLMIFVLLAACDSSDSNGGGGGSSDAGGGGDDGGSSTVAYPREPGYFDPEFDYSTFPTYKIAYLIPATGSFLYDDMNTAFEKWGPRINVDYKGMFASSDGSTEAFLSLIQTHIDQGFHGLLLDGVGDQMMPVLDMANAGGVEIWSVMGIPREYITNYVYNGSFANGPMVMSYIGFDNFMAGYSPMMKLVEWKNQTWPDVPWEKVGVICVGFSGFGQLYERVQGAKKAWCDTNPTFGEYYPGPYDNPRNFWLADMSAIGAFDQASAAQLVTQILSEPNDIEVWLLPAAMDDMSMGAANAVDLMGLTERSCSSCFGGSNLPVQWDAGRETAWRYAEYCAQSMFAEPCILGLWALMSGQATHETLWPQWARAWDKGDIFEFTGERDPIYDAEIVKMGDDGKPIVLEEHFYAQAYLPTDWLEIETYKQFLAWTDLYAYGDDYDNYRYPDYPRVTDLSLYNARPAVPANFHTPPSP